MKLPFRLLMPVVVIAQLAACGGGGGTVGTATTTPTTPTTPTVTVSGVSLGTSLTSVATDGSNSATITATVVDANRNALSGVAVTFATDNGLLSDAVSPTSASGVATVVLRNGTADFSNRTATVTATAGGKSATIPILLGGSTLALAASAGNATVGTDITFTATALNSAPASAGVVNQSIRFSKGAGSTGDGTLSATTATTGTTGIAPTVSNAVVPIRLTPTAAGTVIVVAEWLNAAGAVSVSASQTITVTAPGIAFDITNPTSSPSSLALGSTQAFAVSVTSSINGTAVANVRFAASAGQWSTGSATSTVVPASNVAAETYTPSSSAGTVTVTINALSAAGATLATVSQTLAVSAPASSAASISLQAAASTLKPSSGTNLSTTSVTATVRNATNAAVGGAPVLFELLSTTGTGESIAPAVAFTDSIGVATATFTAGSLATNGPIYIRSSVVGQPACTTAPPAIDPVLTCKSIPLLVNASAVSITIGLGTTITDSGNGTLYKYPGSILVVDNNGSPVAGKTVTLTLFPETFRRGSVSGATGCAPTYTTASLASEDANRNGILDAGEDVSGNGALSPPTADGGAVPSSLVTDASGVATFEITYPKTSGMFISDELTARITVSGTELAAQRKFILPISAADGTATVCPLGGARDFP
ncbi:MAG: Ig-like domain-containing protein [Rhodocyclaceae bacterium]|nr:Ig-like domain-containing protein [Rhodocyclaceae bacterium]